MALLLHCRHRVPKKLQQRSSSSPPRLKISLQAVQASCCRSSIPLRALGKVGPEEQREAATGGPES
eukprot:3706196-Rhodomonas_salina.1